MSSSREASKGSDASPVSLSFDWRADTPSSEADSMSARALTTSSDARASVGRYAFIATTDAPNPTFAHIPSSADAGHIGDEDGRSRKSIAAALPKKAKNRRSSLRCGASERLVRNNKRDIHVSSFCNFVFDFVSLPLQLPCGKV